MRVSQRAGPRCSVPCDRGPWNSRLWMQRRVATSSRSKGRPSASLPKDSSRKVSQPQQSLDILPGGLDGDMRLPSHARRSAQYRRNDPGEHIPSQSRAPRPCTDRDVSVAWRLRLLLWTASNIAGKPPWMTRSSLALIPRNVPIFRSVVSNSAWLPSSTLGSPRPDHNVLGLGIGVLRDQWVGAILEG